MNGQTPSSLTDSLLQDLVEGLTAPESPDAPRSVGLVGHEKLASRPPAHCLRCCLAGDANRLSTNGCEWLVQAAEGQIDPALVVDGCCSQGFKVSARPVLVEGGPAVAVAVENASSTMPSGESHAGLIDALELTARLVERVGQIGEENVGLAGEVLRSYEQLNLMFEFTQQIAHITDVAEIERVLIQRVGCLLDADAVFLVGGGGRRLSCDVASGTVTYDGMDTVLEDQLAEQIERVRTSRQVSVVSGEYGQIILGPLARLGDDVDVVLAARSSAGNEFTSGDMMLAESVLTFGGQIITNSELHAKLRQMSVEVTRALVSAIDQKDHYTSGHSERVGFLSCLTGRKLGLSAEQLQVLEWAGLLHDVGKIGIPEDILNKPGRLTDEEFDAIKRHTIMGYEILKPIASLEHVLDGVLYHHEHPDASGYPEGLSGDKIPLVARIVHVADVFDALSSHRSYRKAFSVEKACDIIRKDAGTKIDATVAQALLEALEEFRTARPDAFTAMFPPIEEDKDDQA